MSGSEDPLSRKLLVDLKKKILPGQKGAVLPIGEVLTRINLVKIFLTPNTRDLKFIKEKIYMCWNFFVGPKKVLLKTL